MTFYLKPSKHPRKFLRWGYEVLSYKRIELYDNVVDLEAYLVQSIRKKFIVMKDRIGVIRYSPTIQTTADGKHTFIAEPVEADSFIKQLYVRISNEN